jgi:ubiquinone biosynthesis protein
MDDGVETTKSIPKPGIMASLPRRAFISIEPTDVSPPKMQASVYSISTARVMVRLFVWLYVGIAISAGNFWDWLRGKSSEKRRAERIRRIFEDTGGTFLKIGRMLAMRIDLLPWAYAVELSKIVDQMDPFPVEDAVRKIESATGKPLADVFDQFDPEPIVSTTMACIYQAVTHKGKKVAIKVRRPGINVFFMADLKALDWILVSLETLSFVRPDFTKNLRLELRESIQDEMNFLLEARHQALFRREAKKSGKKFFSAPRVFFECCSQDVIVEEFAGGMWLWELLAAVERNDMDAAARAEQLNINPKKVAQRLLWVSFWGMNEHLHFRADLHPDNVIIQRNSKLTFIDFSSVGALSQEKTMAVQHTLNSAWKMDPLEMAQESMVLLEPLPPIDTIKFQRDLEAAYWQFLYALESKKINWWERTSARLWLGFVRVAKEHNITVSIQVLRMIRSDLLYDTIAARLYPKINRVKEYRKFASYRGDAARKRMEKRIRSQLGGGIDERIILQTEEIVHTSQRLYRQLQRFLSKPLMKFNATLDKSVYSMSILFRLSWYLVVITGLTVALTYSYAWLTAEEVPSIIDAAGQAFSNRIYQWIVLLLVIINFRTMLFRMSDKEV